MRKQFRRTTLAVWIAALSAAPNAWAADVMCENTNGCLLSSGMSNSVPYWVHSDWQSGGNSTAIHDTNITVKLQAKDYLNVPATHTGIEETTHPDGSKDYNYKIQEIIAVSKHYDGLSAHLIVPKGTNLTLSQAQDNSEIISLYDVSASIADGVNLTVNAGYGESKGLTHPEKSSFWEAGTAIYAVSNSQIDTSANITLNGMGATGIIANGLSNVNTSNHSIALNGEWTSALHAYDAGYITAKNVNISGNAANTYGLDIDEVGNFDSSGKKSTIKLENSQMNLTGHNSAGGFLGGGDVILQNSKIQAAYGLVAYPVGWDGVNNTIELNNSSLSGSQALLAVSPQYLRHFRDEREIHTNKLDINIRANNSHLQGAVILDTDLRKSDEPYGKVNVNLTNNSTWHIQQNSEIDHLQLADSNVHVGQSGAYNVLTINQDLSGKGAFHMNTNLAKLEGDKIVVGGQVSGSHTLYVSDTQNAITDPKGKLTLVQANGGDNDAFILGNANKVVSVGNYLYALAKEGNDWVLKTDTTNPPATNPPVVPPVVPSTPNNPNINNHFGYGLNGRIAHFQAASQFLQNQNSSLNERQNALHRAQRLHGLWTLGEHGLIKRENTHINGSTASGFSQKTSGWQLGYDHKMGSGYVGALLGRARHNLDYNSHYYPDTELNGNTFALYGGVNWGAGWFADATVRHTRYRAHGYMANDKFRVNSLNMQVGKSFALPSDWAIVPQAAITVGQVSGSQIDNGKLFQTRVGADIRKKWTLADGKTLEPHFGVHYLGEHHKMKISQNQESFTLPNAGHRVAAKIGLKMGSGKNTISVNAQTEHGSKMKRPYWVEIGFSRNW